jgi:predicted GIY-YIG superfamily endonuclease
MEFNMSHLRIYLTLPIMLAAIQEVLSTEPYRRYQRSLLASKFRKRLIAFVFARVRTRYRVFIDDAHTPCSSAIKSESLLKEVVRQEINDLIQENQIEHFVCYGLVLPRSLKTRQQPF